VGINLFDVCVCTVVRRFAAELHVYLFIEVFGDLKGSVVVRGVAEMAGEVVLEGVLKNVLIVINAEIIMTYGDQVLGRGHSGNGDAVKAFVVEIPVVGIAGHVANGKIEESGWAQLSNN
jgi:hypothetical protein